MSNELALLGGPPTISKKFEVLNNIGEEEIKSVVEVMKTGMLSKFVGDWRRKSKGI